MAHQAMAGAVPVTAVHEVSVNASGGTRTCYLRASVEIELYGDRELFAELRATDAFDAEDPGCRGTMHIFAQYRNSSVIGETYGNETTGQRLRVYDVTTQPITVTYSMQFTDCSGGGCDHTFVMETK
jgi:hypothetical protein